MTHLGLNVYSNHDAGKAHTAEQKHVTWLTKSSPNLRPSEHCGHYEEIQ